MSNTTYLNLSKLLHIEYEGVEQDWAVELADPNRVREFIEFFRTAHLDRKEKYALIELIISSYDRYLESNEDFNDEVWDLIVNLLRMDMAYFYDIIDYWSLQGSEYVDDLFNVTLRMRQLAK